MHLCQARLVQEIHSFYGSKSTMKKLAGCESHLDMSVCNVITKFTMQIGELTVQVNSPEKEIAIGRRLGTRIRRLTL